MADSSSILSYARPSSADPRLRRWGVVSLIIGLSSLMLTLAGSAVIWTRFWSVYQLGVSQTQPWKAMLYSRPARLQQPNLILTIIVTALLALALLLSLRLLILATRLLRGRSPLDGLRIWARWRVILSLLIPIPAFLLGQNLDQIHAQYPFSPPDINSVMVVGWLLTGLAWAELILPVIIWRKIRR